MNSSHKSRHTSDIDQACCHASRVKAWWPDKPNVACLREKERALSSPPHTLGYLYSTKKIGQRPCTVMHVTTAQTASAFPDAATLFERAVRSATLVADLNL
jgi:hypothetical protein